VPVERRAVFILAENVPVEPGCSSLHGDARDMGEYRAPKTPAPELFPHEQILQEQVCPAQKGGVDGIKQRERRRFIAGFTQDDFGLFFPKMESRIFAAVAVTSSPIPSKTASSLTKSSISSLSGASAYRIEKLT
jgi:hypothetical protein